MAAITHVGSHRPALAFDATGERLACATSAEQVGVWRFGGGLVQKHPTWLNAPRIVRVRFGPGTNLLASATTDGHIVVLGIGTDARWQSEPVHKGTILDLAFTGPTGLRSVDSQGTVIDWALGEEGIRQTTTRALPSGARPDGAVFHANGARLTWVGADGLRTWDFQGPGSARRMAGESR